MSTVITSTNATTASSSGAVHLEPACGLALAQAVDITSRRPATSFFLTHWWLDACAKIWPASAGHRLLSIRGSTLSSEPSAYALLGCRTVKRHGWLTVRSLALNEAIDEELDEPTVELNGLFGAADEEFPALFDTLLGWLDKKADWDELQVAGLPTDRAETVRRLAEHHGLRTRVLKHAPSYWADLQQIREQSAGVYLDALSSNTRQQLRRARRALEKEQGQLAIEAASSLDEALHWLDELGRFHQARWTAKGERSGFGIPTFVEFHRELIRQAFPSGHIQLLRCTAGSQAIAYLYNFQLDGRIYFNMSGIDYSYERFKPGMLAHQLAIEYNLRQGARLYDFLGGASRYKESLSTHGDAQQWLVLWRPRVKLLVEDALRRFRNRVKTRARPEKRSAD